MLRDFQKSINSTRVNTRVNKARIDKQSSSNCNYWIVYVWVWHIQKANRSNKLYIYFWQYRCNSEFSAFLTFELRFITLFLDICDLLDRVCQPRCWFVSDKLNLFSTVEYFWIQRNHLGAKSSPYWNLWDGETRLRSCKHPTSPCALAKVLPETTVRA